MKLIVGLGNPGIKYEKTRHNVGFLIVDYFLYDDGFLQAKPSHDFKSEMYTWQNGKEKIIFLKPQTFMNDTGQALRVVCNFYKMDLAQDLLVIHDDVDLPFGTIRTTNSASSAGHKGVQSIIDNLGTQNFYRIRIGVENRTDKTIPSTDDFVLQNFTNDEIKRLKTNILPKVKQEIENFLKITVSTLTESEDEQ